MKDRWISEAEILALREAFPELDWMHDADWRLVGAFRDWPKWFDEYALEEQLERGEALRKLLESREKRIRVRRHCREYFGMQNVPNVNDPEDETWA